MADTIREFATLIPPNHGTIKHHPEFVREPGWLRRHHPDAADTLNRMVNGYEPWPLFVTGDVGSGKTGLALALLDVFGGLYYTRRQWTERMTDATFQRLQGQTGYRVSAGEARLEWSRARLAVMDELGTTAKVTDFAREEVQCCLDARMGKPTLYVSNMDLDTIGTLYDDRIASRLSEGTILELKGDYRREKK